MLNAEKSRLPKQAEAKLTASQKKAIDRIRDQAIDLISHGDTDRFEPEVKEETLSIRKGFAGLTLVVGYKGDDKRGALILTREMYHVFVGVRGGLSYMPRGSTKSKPLKVWDLYKARM